MTMLNSDSDEPRLLRAGPLSLQYSGGEVRSVRVGHAEVVRRIYGAVRDRDWNTVPLQVLAESVEQSADGFRVWFEARHQAAEIDFGWRGEIVGQSDGTLRFGFEGSARSGFWRNRIGLCVLHPLEAAGSRARVEHADGSAEDGALPIQIAPRCPFESIAAFEHQAGPELWARLLFEGEAFEMEDQRNWSDASFKTYGTPLSLPFPVRVAPGTRVSQTVTLSLRGLSAADRQAAAPADSGRARARVRVEVGSGAVCKLAPLGLLWHELSGDFLSEREAHALRVLRPAHLRVDLQLADESWAPRLRRAAAAARSVGARLEIALTIRSADELERLAQSCEQVLAGVPIDCWLLLAPGLGALAPEILQAARQKIARFDKEAAFGSGSDANFAELNRARPSNASLQTLDLVCFASNPQVHAFDDASLFETCLALPQMIASARGFALGCGVALSPLTLKPRFNAVATSQGPQVLEQPLLPGQIPANADERQSMLIGAAWTVAALSALAPCALRHATIFEAVGWRGVIGRAERAGDSGAPILFPLFHVLAAANAFAGADVLPVRCGQPSRACALALRCGTSTRILLANTSREPLELDLELASGASSSARVAILNQPSAAQARREPHFFGSGSGDERAWLDGALRLRLEAYGVARVDFEAE